MEILSCLVIICFCIADLILYDKNISNYVWSIPKELHTIQRILPGSGFYVWWKTRHIRKAAKENK